MNAVDRFMHNLEYLVRDNPKLLDEFKQDVCQDLQTFFAYIEELENLIDRPEVKDELENQEGASFERMLAKYRGIIHDIELGNLRREASSLRREGHLNELLQRLCRKPQEEVA